MHDEPVPVRVKVSIIGIIYFVLCLLFNALQIYVTGFHFSVDDFKPLLSGAIFLFITSFGKTFLFGITPGGDS